MSNWIRCDERKPEENVYVFGAIYGTDIVIQQPNETRVEAIMRSAICNPRVRICQWCGEEEGWWTDHGLMVVQPLFWMEIRKPEPPAITEKDVFDR